MKIRIRNVVTSLIILLVLVACLPSSSSSSAPVQPQPVLQVTIPPLQLPTVTVAENIDVIVVNNSGTNFCWIYLVSPGATNFDNILYNLNYVDNGESGTIRDVAIGLYDVHGLDCGFNDIAIGSNLLIDAAHNVITFPQLAVVPTFEPLVDPVTGRLEIINNTTMDMCSIALTKPGDLTVIKYEFQWYSDPISTGEKGFVDNILIGLYDVTFFDCNGFSMARSKNAVISITTLEITINP